MRKIKLNKGLNMLNKNSETLDSIAETELQPLQLSSVKNVQEEFNRAEIYFDPDKPLYGMSPEQYIEGIRFHNKCFTTLNSL